MDDQLLSIRASSEVSMKSHFVLITSLGKHKHKHARAHTLLDRYESAEGRVFPEPFRLAAVLTAQTNNIRVREGKQKASGLLLESKNMSGKSSLNS